MLIYLFTALAAGFVIANQNPINADLRKIVGSPFIAASLSFFVGSIFLGIISLFASHRLLPSFDFILAQPLWIWLGGLLGAIYLTSNVLLFPRLGAVQTVILPILGQILMGTVIDSFGWFESPSIALSFVRVLGVLLLLIGVLVAVVLPSLSKKTEKKQEKKKSNLLFWQIWAVIAGSFSAMQQAINGRLGSLLKSPAQGAFISFFIGFIIIALVALAIDQRFPTKAQLRSMKIWNGAGGILGGLFVFASVIAVPQIGAGLTIMMGLIGQIVGSMLVAQFGWWKSGRYPINIWQVVGVLIMFVGIILIKFL